MLNIRFLIIIFIQTVFVSNISCQDSTFFVPLIKKIGLKNDAFFQLKHLTKVQDYAKYKYRLPENTTAYVIGRVLLNYYQPLFNNRNQSSEDRKKFMESFNHYHYDTLQFFQKTYLPEYISAFVSIDGKNKRIRIDANSNFDFNDDKEYVVDITDKLHGVTSASSNYINLKVEIKCLSDYTSSIIYIPICIDTEYNNPRDTIAGNNQLQLYISPDFYYSGKLNSGSDTVNLVLNVDGFDTFYDNASTEIKFKYNTPYQPVTLYGTQNSIFQINSKRFKYESFDPIKKTLHFRYLGKDSVGNQPGNYLKIAPGLENISSYTLLFFTGSWCKPCKPVLDSLLSLYKMKYRIKIISVNHEVDTSEFMNYLNKYKIPWQVILDKAKKQWVSLYSDTYEIRGYPTLYLINPKRTILRIAKDKNSCVNLLEEIKTHEVKYFEKQ